jgi:general secretion pathway protein H
MRTWRTGVCNERGFTLVELAMVILVLGIVTAVTMPRVGGMLDTREMQRAVNVVRGAARLAQARAALTKRVYRLTFDFDKQSMSVCYLPDPGNPEECIQETGRELRPYTFPAVARLLDVIGPTGEKTVTGAASTHFHPAGLAEPSTIHLGEPNAQQMTLVIEPLSARIKVLDGYVEPQAS